MAAILTDRLSNPRAGSPGAGVFPAPRVSRRDPNDLPVKLKRIWSTTCEGLLLLWMVAVTAFFVLMAVGAAGFLG